jgi:hypothetical protein
MESQSDFDKSHLPNVTPIQRYNEHLNSTLQYGGDYCIWKYFQYSNVLSFRQILMWLGNSTLYQSHIKMPSSLINYRFPSSNDLSDNQRIPSQSPHSAVNL